MSKLIIYRGKYYDFPEYSARITGHYAGDMLVLEEIGAVSESCGKKIAEEVNLIPHTLYELGIELIKKLLESNDCSSDRDILEKALKSAMKSYKILIQLKQ